MLSSEAKLSEMEMNLCLTYSQTNAEKVLEASGTALERSDVILRTCALRPAGIYRLREQRHLPRIVSYIEKGLFKFL